MKLSSRQIAVRLAAIPGWAFKKNALVRRFVFPSFPDAIAFVARLGFSAEAADHHPDLQVNYKKVTVIWTTHSDGGVTKKDFAGAEESDKIASAFKA